MEVGHSVIPVSLQGELGMTISASVMTLLRDAEAFFDRPRSVRAGDRLLIRVGLALAVGLVLHLVGMI